MQEMDRLPIDLGDELWEGIELGFLRAPIKAAALILRQFLQVTEGHATAPAHIGDFVGPLCLCQPVIEFIKCCLGNMDGKRLNRHLNILLIGNAGLSIDLGSYLLSIIGANQDRFGPNSTEI